MQICTICNKPITNAPASRRNHIECKTLKRAKRAKSYDREYTPGWMMHAIAAGIVKK